MRFLDNLALLVGRIFIAALFLPAGISKAGNISGFAGFLGSKGLPMPQVLAGASAFVEIVGPILLILGVLPRITAIVLIGFTAVATLVSHMFWMMPDAAAQAAQQTQFLKNVAIMGGLMAYFAAGPGAYALGRKEA